MKLIMFYCIYFLSRRKISWSIRQSAQRTQSIRYNFSGWSIMLLSLWGSMLVVLAFSPWTTNCIGFILWRQPSCMVCGSMCPPPTMCQRHVDFSTALCHMGYGSSGSTWPPSALLHRLCSECADPWALLHHAAVEAAAVKVCRLHLNSLPAASWTSPM